MQLLAYCVMFLFCSQIDQRIKNFEVIAHTHVLREKRSADDGEETTIISKNEHHEDEPFHRAHSDLINSLLENYDMSASPTHVSNKPTVISVNLQVISLDDISDTKMEYIIDTRMTFFWMDGRLMSPECRDENKDCDDQFDLKKHLPDLWTPDLYILNSRFVKLHDQPFENSMLYLIATGKVILSKRLTLTLRCPMDLVLYPLDTQRCPLLICPYSLPEEELIMKWAEKSVSILNTDKGGKNKFDLEKPIRTGHMKLKYDGPDVSGYFSCVNATFTFKRHKGYHISYFYTITSFIVIVSWIAFWLPVTAVPARITLGITTLLTLLTTANFIRGSLPPVSYITAIDVWIGICSLFVLSSLLLFPFSHYCSSKTDCKFQKTNIKPPNRIIPASGKCSSCGGKRSFVHVHNKETSVDVDRVCRTLFPVLFIIFNITYWSYYLSWS